MNELRKQNDASGIAVPLRQGGRGRASGLTSRDRSAAAELSEVQWTIVDLCVRAARALGAPRSHGEIFGVIFCSPRPITFDDVARVLKLSSGAASQGLRQLKRLGAVRTCYLAMDRRDHYVAETSLHKVISSYFAETILAHLGKSEQELADLRVATPRGRSAAHVLEKIDLLLDSSRQLRCAMNAAAAAMK